MGCNEAETTLRGQQERAEKGKRWLKGLNGWEWDASMNAAMRGQNLCCTQCLQFSPELGCGLLLQRLQCRLTVFLKTCQLRCMLSPQLCQHLKQRKTESKQNSAAHLNRVPT